MGMRMQATSEGAVCSLQPGAAVGRAAAPRAKAQLYNNVRTSTRQTAGRNGRSNIRRLESRVSVEERSAELREVASGRSRLFVVAVGQLHTLLVAKVACVGVRARASVLKLVKRISHVYKLLVYRIGNYRTFYRRVVVGGCIYSTGGSARRDLGAPRGAARRNPYLLSRRVSVG